MSEIPSHSKDRKKAPKYKRTSHVKRFSHTGCLSSILVANSSILRESLIPALPIPSDDGSCMLPKHKDSSHLASVRETLDMSEHRYSIHGQRYLATRALSRTSQAVWNLILVSTPKLVSVTMPPPLHKLRMCCIHEWLPMRLELLNVQPEPPPSAHRQAHPDDLRGHCQVLHFLHSQPAPSSFAACRERRGIVPSCETLAHLI